METGPTEINFALIYAKEHTFFMILYWIINWQVIRLPPKPWLAITDTQSNLGWNWSLEAIYYNPLLHTNTISNLNLVAQGSHPVKFKNLQGWSFHSFSGQTALGSKNLSRYYEINEKIIQRKKKKTNPSISISKARKLKKAKI